MSERRIKYEVIKHTGSYYIVGLYDGWKLVAKFKAYPYRNNPDYFILYFMEFVNFTKGIDVSKKKVHYSDIKF